MESLPAEDNLIHCANGTLHLEDDSFTEEKNFCRCRLPVAYHPEAPVPERWLTFLSQLFYPEDIPSVQEFFGYCLIPSTKAHKMMLVTGRGGEGKSRLGIVLQKLSILFGGAASYQMELKKILRENKSLKSEVRNLEQQLETNTRSVLEELQEKQRLLELEEKERLLSNIPKEIIEQYNRPKGDKGKSLNKEQNLQKDT